MEDIISIEEIKKQELYFWPFFFCSCFPNGYSEEDDVEITDYLQKNYNIDMVWVHSFTKYCSKVYEDCDGYVTSPRTLLIELNLDTKLGIEFHPGDTLFHLNGEKVGSTGPHFQIHTIAWDYFMRLTEGCPIEAFFALLPLSYIMPSEYNAAIDLIKKKFLELPFEGNKDEILLNCILANLQPDESHSIQ